MAKKKSGGSMLGSWAFLIGVILAVVLGFLGLLNQTWIWVLAVIGLIVGFLNVTDEESQPFLMSGAVLIIAAAFGRDVMSAAPLLSNVLDALLAIFVPSTIIVAIKNVFSMARN